MYTYTLRGIFLEIALILEDFGKIVWNFGIPLCAFFLLDTLYMLDPQCLLNVFPMIVHIKSTLSLHYLPIQRTITMMDANANANVIPDIFTTAGVPPLVVVAAVASVVDDEATSVVVVDVVDGFGRNGVTMGWLIGVEEELRDEIDVDVDSSPCVCVCVPVSADVEAGASP